MGMPLEMVSVIAESTPTPPLGPAGGYISDLSGISRQPQRYSLARTIPLTSPYLTIDSKILGSVSW
jgi:hypothetical protein